MKTVGCKEFAPQPTSRLQVIQRNVPVPDNDRNMSCQDARSDRNLQHKEWQDV